MLIEEAKQQYIAFPLFTNDDIVVVTDAGVLDCKSHFCIKITEVKFPDKTKFWRGEGGGVGVILWLSQMLEYLIVSHIFA